MSTSGPRPGQEVPRPRRHSSSPAGGTALAGSEGTAEESRQGGKGGARNGCISGCQSGCLERCPSLWWPLPLVPSALGKEGEEGREERGLVSRELAPRAGGLRALQNSCPRLLQASLEPRGQGSQKSTLQGSEPPGTETINPLAMLLHDLRAARSLTASGTSAKSSPMLPSSNAPKSLLSAPPTPPQGPLPCFTHAHCSRGHPSTGDGGLWKSLPGILPQFPSLQL